MLLLCLTDAKELSRFLNMIILRIFNGGKREIIFG